MVGEDNGAQSPAGFASLTAARLGQQPERLRAGPGPESDGVTVTASVASPMAVLGTGSLTAYWRFQRGVAKAQLAAWLPAGRGLLIDISGPSASSAAQAAAQGHTVLRVVPATQAEAAARAGAAGRPGSPARPGAPARYGTPARHPAPDAASSRHGRAAGHGLVPRPGPAPGRVCPVVAEPGSLAFLADGCVDAVIAEDGALSRHLVAEDLAAEIARVLKPGGELLACVDSLVLGMAILAEQHHWAHLTDVPNAEVVLVPWPDGTISRCFGAGHLSDLLTEAGLDVLSIQPRTILSPSMVDHVLSRDPGALARLVKAELHAGQHRLAGASPDESFGISLVAAARKPPAGARPAGRPPAG